MGDWKRVRDKRTGHEYSVRNVNPKIHEVVDKPAETANGKPLKPLSRVNRPAAAKAPAEAKGAVK